MFVITRFGRRLRQLATIILFSFCCLLFTHNLLITVLQEQQVKKSAPSEHLNSGSEEVEDVVDVDDHGADVEVDRGLRILGDDTVRFTDKIPQGIDPKYKGKAKVIVTWNAGHSQANLGGCPDWNCELTDDRSKVNEADAILFSNAVKIPGRRPHQYYVHFTQESPLHHQITQPYPGFFNLSLGYRRDSAVSSPYGYAIELKDRLPLDAVLPTDQQLRNKTKSVAWFVSNCQTGVKREEYVSELEKHIAVDKYGACSSLSCPKGPECQHMLKSTYRFYLALENSICKDYMTEKLWSQGFLDVIPIVLKGDIIQAYVPPHSFIALDDFSSPKHLAEYLHTLMDNDTAYREYFVWKRQFKVIFLDGRKHDYRERAWGFCRLCRLLWENPRPIHVLTDIRDWWTGQANCDYGTYIPKLMAQSKN